VIKAQVYPPNASQDLLRSDTVREVEPYSPGQYDMGGFEKNIDKAHLIGRYFMIRPLSGSRGFEVICGMRAVH